MHLKMLSRKWRQFCLGFSVLMRHDVSGYSRLVCTRSKFYTSMFMVSDLFRTNCSEIHMKIQEFHSRKYIWKCFFCRISAILLGPQCLKHGILIKKFSFWFHRGDFWVAYDPLLWVEINTLWYGQNGCYFADHIFKCLFMSDMFCVID